MLADHWGRRTSRFDTSWMVCSFVGLFVLLVDLDGLGRLGSDKAVARLVEVERVYCPVMVSVSRILPEIWKLKSIRTFRFSAPAPLFKL